ncbi:MAG: M6 family metalloprotease domain-containing protein [Elusimicrobiales bacterium]|nr:M6 family metalloprotease domain-containing protein [Elusimicrobiales bacterium]
MRLFAGILTLLLAFSRAGLAMDPPPDGPASRYSFGIDPALGIGNQSFSPELVSRLGGNRGTNLLGFRDSGLPSTGSPKMLVLLVEFDEYPARPADTPEALREKIFGSGGEFPYESLSAYYRRSSYGRLNLGGNVLGWYKAGRRADVPETREGREALIKKALLSFKGHDFSQYDSDGDGAVDYFAVIWTGPVGDWATFWWAVAPYFSDRDFSAGGKRLYAYSWQGIVSKWDDPASAFKIKTLVHETGHALGLPDYYDYKPEIGPKGGLGYFDMMDSTRYDHNCFSKMMLGWLEPRVITAGGDFRLNPATEAGECLLLMPRGQAKEPLGEYFLVENRRKTGNDTENSMIGGGLVIWHVNAKLNPTGTNFLYNNSTTERKLLKILEADGLEELERGKSSSFGFLDFYLKDRALGPDTVPSSRLYDGTDTGLSLVSKGGDHEVSFTVGLK